MAVRRTASLPLADAGNQHELDQRNVGKAGKQIQGS
jgi:hypothetical protein